MIDIHSSSSFGLDSIDINNILMTQPTVLWGVIGLPMTEVSRAKLHLAHTSDLLLQFHTTLTYHPAKSAKVHFKILFILKVFFFQINAHSSLHNYSSSPDEGSVDQNSTPAGHTLQRECCICESQFMLGSPARVNHCIDGPRGSLYG